MRRNVRQRCGFGCVICGTPIYDYDHIENWSEVREHEESNLTLLCVQHHREKTNGLLPVDVVKVANATPYNVEHGITAPYGLHFGGQQVDFILGSVRFRSMGGPTFVPIMVDDQAILAFHEIDGDLGIYIVDYDDFNYPILVIEHNVLRVGLNSWDVSFIGQELTIRTGPGEIKLAIKFEPPNRVVIGRAQLKRNGVVVDVHPDHMTINGFVLADFTLEAPEVAVRIGPQIDQPPSSSIYLAADRYDRSRVSQMVVGGRDPLMRPWDERTTD
jgi:trigger factor